MMDLMNVGSVFYFYCRQRNSYSGVSWAPFMLLMTVLFCLITITTTSFAVENNEIEVDGFVLAGSIDNQFSITVTNPGSKSPVENLSLSITNEPEWLTNIRIEADKSGDLKPKTSREYTITFNVREGAEAGTIETVTFQVSGDLEFIDYPNPEMTVEIVEPSVTVCMADSGTSEEPGYLECKEKKPVYSTDEIWVLYKPSPCFKRIFQWRIVDPDGKQVKSGTHRPGDEQGNNKYLYDIRKDEDGGPLQLTIHMTSLEGGLYTLQMRTEFSTPEMPFGQGGGREGEWEDEGHFEIIPANVYFQGFVAQKEVTFGNPANKAKLEIISSAQGNTVSLDLLGTWLRRKCMESPYMKPEIVGEKSHSSLKVTFPETIDLGRYISQSETESPPVAENNEYSENDKISIKLVSLERGRLRFQSCRDEEGGIIDNLEEMQFDLEFAGLVPVAENPPMLWDYIGKAWNVSKATSIGNFLQEKPSIADNYGIKKHNYIKGPDFDNIIIYSAGLSSGEKEIGAPARMPSDHLRKGDTKWYMPVRIHMVTKGSSRSFGPYITGYAVYGSTAGGDIGPGPSSDDLVKKRTYKRIKVEGPDSFSGDKSREYAEGSLGFLYSDKLNPDGFVLSDNIGSIESYRFTKVPPVINSGESFEIALDAKVRTIYLPGYVRWTGGYNHKPANLEFNMEGNRIYNIYAGSKPPPQASNSVSLNLKFVPVPDEVVGASLSYLAEVSTSGTVIGRDDLKKSLTVLGYLSDPPQFVMDTGRGRIDIYYQIDKDDTLSPSSVIPYDHPDMSGPATGDTQETGEEDTGIARGPDTEEDGAGHGPVADVGDDDIIGTGEGDRERPVDPDTLDPASPNVSGAIREWISVAKPPENVSKGANLRYSNKGYVIGTVPGGVIESRHETGAFDPVFLWKNMRRLDSVDHCTLEEYVVAKLEGQSIEHCRGRYKTLNNLTEMKKFQAKDELKQAGLKYDFLDSEKPAPSEQLERTVESQDPAPNSVIKRGDTVMLYIYGSYVPPEIKVPDVLGKSKKRAKEIIKDAGFNIEFVSGTPASSEQQENTVESQYPGPGKELRQGETVELTFYGKYNPNISVPDVLGKTKKRAKEIIKDAGFYIEFVSGTPASYEQQENTVESQYPGPGKELKQGETVELTFYGKYNPYISVPDVLGKTKKRAKETIKDAGFNIEFVTGTPASSEQQENTVESQYPGPGIEIMHGQTVELTVYGSYAREIPLPIPVVTTERDVAAGSPVWVLQKTLINPGNYQNDFDTKTSSWRNVKRFSVSGSNLIFEYKWLDNRLGALKDMTFSFNVKNLPEKIKAGVPVKINLSGMVTNNIGKPFAETCYAEIRIQGIKEGSNEPHNFLKHGVKTGADYSAVSRELPFHVPEDMPDEFEIHFHIGDTAAYIVWVYSKQMEPRMRSRDVSVPDVVNVPFKKAIYILNENGLVADLKIDKIPTSRIQEDNVYFQNPSAGVLFKRGDTVTIYAYSKVKQQITDQSNVRKPYRPFIVTFEMFLIWPKEIPEFITSRNASSEESVIQENKRRLQEAYDKPNNTVIMPFSKISNSDQPFIIEFSEQGTAAFPREIFEVGSKFSLPFNGNYLDKDDGSRKNMNGAMLFKTLGIFDDRSQVFARYPKVREEAQKPDGVIGGKINSSKGDFYIKNEEASIDFGPLERGWSEKNKRKAIEFAKNMILDFKCFVATAVYCDPMSPELFTLRGFRDTVLLSSIEGQNLVKIYYRYGPALAEKVKEYPMVSGVIRNVLDMIVYWFDSVDLQDSLSRKILDKAVIIIESILSLFVDEDAEPKLTYSINETPWLIDPKSSEAKKELNPGEN